MVHVFATKSYPHTGLLLPSVCPPEIFSFSFDICSGELPEQVPTESSWLEAPVPPILGAIYTGEAESGAPGQSSLPV